MTTNELEGRALAEAAARAMGCRNVTLNRMLAWLHSRRGTRQGWSTNVHSTECSSGYMLELWVDDSQVAVQEGGTLREALARLVVAVAAREQAAKGEP